jgi:hypothetical protein
MLFPLSHYQAAASKKSEIRAGLTLRSSLSAACSTITPLGNLQFIIGPGGVFTIFNPMTYQDL